ncbi:hypothetical protein GCM10020000_07690 [Streptomyces olivoverticillatus]
MPRDRGVRAQHLASVAQQDADRGDGHGERGAAGGRSERCGERRVVRQQCHRDVAKRSDEGQVQQGCHAQQGERGRAEHGERGGGGGEQQCGPARRQEGGEAAGGGDGEEGRDQRRPDRPDHPRVPGDGGLLEERAQERLVVGGQAGDEAGEDTRPVVLLVQLAVHAVGGERGVVLDGRAVGVGAPGPGATDGALVVQAGQDGGDGRPGEGGCPVPAGRRAG